MTATDTRFRFGRNWANFVHTVDIGARLPAVERGLSEGLGELEGLTFCDVGCGSGLFSLAASRLGARVHSFDFDCDSVGTAESLRETYAPQSDWVIERGDVLDANYLAKLGTFDVVYAWGVLHHTGELSRALENVVSLVASCGRLWIAVYIDEGARSSRWRTVKAAYNRYPPLRPVLLAGSLVRLWGPALARDTIRGRSLHSLRRHAGNRGMSPWHDLVDWVGGFPFEVSTFALLEEFAEAHGLETVWCIDGSVERRAMHELVLRRPAEQR